MNNNKLLENFVYVGDENLNDTVERVFDIMRSNSIDSDGGYDGWNSKEICDYLNLDCESESVYNNRLVLSSLIIAKVVELEEKYGTRIATEIFLESNNNILKDNELKSLFEKITDIAESKYANHYKALELMGLSLDTEKNNYGYKYLNLTDKSTGETITHSGDVDKMLIAGSAYAFANNKVNAKDLKHLVDKLTEGSKRKFSDYLEKFGSSFKDYEKKAKPELIKPKI